MMDNESERESASFLLKAYESFVPDIVRKTVLLGLGGVSVTEDGLRRILGDLRLPREEAKRLRDYLVEQSQKTKVEAVGRVGAEVKGFLRTLSLEELLRGALSGLKVKINAEISFEETSPGSGPQLELNTRIEPREEIEPNHEETDPPIASDSDGQSG